MPATPASQWKKSSNTQELSLPSGNICLVKKLDPVELISADIFPDSMTKQAQGLVDQHGRKLPQDHLPPGGRREVETTAQERMAAMPREEREKLFKAFDIVTAMAVVEPKVYNHHEHVEGEPRHEDGIYTDYIDFADKMAIFKHAMEELSSLDTFRDADEAVGGVAPREGVPL